MAEALGGRVERGTTREYGPQGFVTAGPHRLFDGVPQRTQVWMSHGDEVVGPPEGFAVLGRSADGKIASIGNDGARLYGLQFHPEVVHTEGGARLIENFVHAIAGIEGDWTPASFIGEAVETIRTSVGDARVVCALSGGVDSSVMSVLVHRAIGDRLVPIFVDNGLLRKNEELDVVARLREGLGLHIRTVDARERFLSKLAGVVDPEAKRKIIGTEFIRVFEEEARGMGGARFLAQGTLYPDVIESVSVKGPSATIKSHHNVGGLPERMDLELIEPLKTLFKDEVRNVGRELGIDEEILRRHPFPGPGLAVRILGDVTAARVAVLQEADAIALEEIRKRGALRPDLAGLRRAPARAERGRHGGRANVRARGRRARRGLARRDDRALVSDAPRRARADLREDHQRGPRREPRVLRHQLEAAVNHRVGVGRGGE